MTPPSHSHASLLHLSSSAFLPNSRSQNGGEGVSSTHPSSRYLPSTCRARACKMQSERGACVAGERRWTALRSVDGETRRTSKLFACSEQRMRRNRASARQHTKRATKQQRHGLAGRHATTKQQSSARSGAAWCEAPYLKVHVDCGEKRASQCSEIRGATKRGRVPFMFSRSTRTSDGTGAPSPKLRGRGGVSHCPVRARRAEQAAPPFTRNRKTGNAERTGREWRTR